MRTRAKRKTRRSNLGPLTTSKTKRRAADKLAASVQENFPPGMSQPALRALADAGLSSVGQLSKIREADLAKLHGIGPKAIKILRAELQRLGKSFRA